MTLSSICVAVGSGKGGVGKSTTSVNLALMAAKEGMRTALIDVDPLSDIAVILDLPASLMNTVTDNLESENLLDYTIAVFKNMDILFPHIKIKYKESERLKELLFKVFAKQLLSSYDLIILDMPAGIGNEENLSFMPHLGTVIIVLNPEPTSHVSGGGYAKAILEINPGLNVFLWHNKYIIGEDPAFNAKDLVGNYNRMVPDDLKLEPVQIARIENLAFVPHDASLDLLRSDENLHHMLFVRMIDCIEAIEEQVTATIPESMLANSLAKLVRFYTIKNYPGIDTQGVLSYITMICQPATISLSLEHRLIIEKYMLAQRKHPIKPYLHKVKTVLIEISEALGTSALADTSTSQGKIEKQQKLLLQSMTVLLSCLAINFSENKKRPWPLEHHHNIKNLAGLLLFYTSLFLVADHPRIKNRILSFVPHKKNAKGHIMRDRFKQLQVLIHHDVTYHTAYFSLLKDLFPVLENNMVSLSARKSWNTLLFRAKDGKVHHNAYLKLLSATMHDLVNAGLGLYVGIKHNRAATAIQNGLHALVASKQAKKTAAGMQNRALF